MEQTAENIININTPEPNEAQKKCIQKTKEGKYLIIAGPGTGKTFTVTKKIKHMIEIDKINPKKILCLTFSSTAAREMKNRIGNNYNVDVFTYHEFCLEIIKEFNSEFDITEAPVASDTIKRNLITECINELFAQGHITAYNNEKNNPCAFSGEIYNCIEEIKKNRFDLKTFTYNLKNNPMWMPRLKELPNIISEKKEELTKLQQEQDTLNQRKSQDISKDEKNYIREKSKEYTALKNAKKKEIDNLEKQEQNISTKIKKMSEIWQLYDLYNSKMHSMGYIDFYDMINIVLNKFEDENSNLLEEISHKYEYILVDEYQDTNKAQNDIVFNLAKYCRNIFVVGDDDQIIYTFQGANLDTLENYMNNFNEVEPIILRENNRSTQTILEVSKVLANLQDEFDVFMRENNGIVCNKSKLRLCSKDKFKEKLPLQERENPKKLICPEKSKMYNIKNPVEYYSFENKDEERDYIVYKIKQIISQIGCKNLSQIAILTKSNADLKDFETYLKANGIPTEMTGGKNIFDISSVNTMITYMQFLTNPKLFSDKMLAYMALGLFNIDPRDYKTLYEYKSNHKSLVENLNNLLEKGLSEESLKLKLNSILNSNSDTLNQEIEKLLGNKTITLYNRENLEYFINNFNYLREYIKNESYINSIIEIGKKTRIFEYYCNTNINQIENIKGIRKLIEEANNYYTQNNSVIFSQFVEYLTDAMNNNVQIKLEQEEISLNAVQLSTYHSSKGREFEYVFMPYLTDAKFENNNSEKNEHKIPLNFPENATYYELAERLEQERFLDYIKILYVGMTRAKHTLILSSIELDKNKQTLSWFIKKVIHNKYLQENGYLITPEKEDFTNLKKPILYSDYNYDKDFEMFIKNRIQQSFSPSSLNCYRKCPKQYFYKYILDLDFDFQNKDNLCFGNAIHKAFEYAINYNKVNKKYPNNRQVYKVFLKSISRSVHKNQNAAKKSAREYIFENNKFYQKFINISENEYEILNTFAELKLNYNVAGINFNGTIDRIDEIKNKNNEISFAIYDYKTGTNSKGITKGGEHSDYYYQIAFYKYLYEKINPDKKISKLCFLYPLLPDESIVIPAGLKEGKMEQTSEEVAAEFIEIAQKIKNLEFECPNKCPNEKYCNYKNICKMNML